MSLVLGRAASGRVAVREKGPNADKVILSTHCHNDLGLAVANTLAAIDAGEPAILLGTDTGPNPAEYLLHALAAKLVVVRRAADVLRRNLLQLAQGSVVELDRLAARAPAPGFGGRPRLQRMTQINSIGAFRYQNGPSREF